MPNTIVIADDVTGANDIGVMYARSGLNTFVYSYTGGPQDYRPCDVLIIDTDSRFDTYEKAYQKVYDAVSAVPKDGVKQFIDKQCSVFRGNIGAEFDAMLDALSEDFAVVVLGFPDNGRTTLHSRHFVYGVPLEDSQFKNDPVHPMNQSNLVEILQEQTKRKVGAVSYEVYEQGPRAVADALEKARGECNYLIMDVRDNEDLKLLAGVLSEEKILCGSSALSGYLAELMEKGETMGTPHEEEDAAERIFCVAGSLTPQTAAQISWIGERGYPVVTLDTGRLLDEALAQAEYERVFDCIVKGYELSGFVLLHSVNSPDEVAKTKRLAADRGIDNTRISSLVSGALSSLSERVIQTYGLRRLIVCGGDTSASLCARLGVKGMRVLKEIEPGLPTCESVSEPFYRLVLKSGSFGSRGFIETAMEKLRK